MCDKYLSEKLGSREKPIETNKFICILSTGSLKGTCVVIVDFSSIVIWKLS